jgi:hypothetical protein
MCAEDVVCSDDVICSNLLNEAQNCWAVLDRLCLCITSSLVHQIIFSVFWLTGGFIDEQNLIFYFNPFHKNSQRLANFKIKILWFCYQLSGVVQDLQRRTMSLCKKTSWPISIGIWQMVNCELECTMHVEIVRHIIINQFFINSFNAMNVAILDSWQCRLLLSWPNREHGEQMAYHILQDCPLFEVQCQQTWLEDHPGGWPEGYCPIRHIHRSKNLMLLSNAKEKKSNTSVWFSLDSKSSRFNVLNMPISTTAPVDTKTQTHVWPIDGIAQWLTNQRSLLGHIQAKTWDVFWLAAGYCEHRVNNYKRIIDMHIILVCVVHSIQYSCIKYSTQNQNFAEMFTTLTILIIIWISIILLFQFIWDFIYSAIIHMCLMSVMEFSRTEYSADHSALFRRNSENLCYRSSGWYA